MYASWKLAPFTKALTSTYLSTSAAAAAKSCSGGSDGVTCGTKWTTGTWDGTWGVGQQMCALSVIQGQLEDEVRGPLSNTTGGTSQGNPSAGTGGDTNPAAPQSVITTGDRAGAGILTAVVLVGLVGGAWYAPRKRFRATRTDPASQVDDRLIGASSAHVTPRPKKAFAIRPALWH